MTTNRATRVALAASLAVTAAAPAMAQPYQQGPYQQGPYQGQYQGQQQPSLRRGGPGNYQDGYKDGYRAGFQASRLRARYNDTPPYTLAGAGGGGGGGDDAEQRWRQRYGQTYSYNDDRYYQECRNTADPGGVLAGALIGGLLGNAAGHGGARGGTTVAGVIVGGAVGAGLTQHLQCEDRSYAYKSYYDGLNSGRARSDWQWDNPDNGNYGDFRVGDYYTDQYGFRCATYTQKVWVQGEPQLASGQACQQPDGTWAIVS